MTTNLDSPLVSVVVPVYKTEKYLRECVDSVLNQTLKETEIILVDDGSTDRCPAMCDEYAEQSSRNPDSMNIRVIHQTNGGLSVARNSGMDIAKGKYILFLDSDDWIEPTLCEKTVAEAERMQEADMTYFLWQTFCNLNTISYIAGLVLGSGNFTSTTLRSGGALQKTFLTDISAWNRLWRTEFLRQNNIRFPDGIWCEDVVFTWKSITHKPNIALVPEFLHHYRVHSENHMNDKSCWGEPYPLKAATIVRQDLIDRKIYNGYLKKFFLRNTLPWFAGIPQGINGSSKEQRVTQFVKDIHQFLRPDEWEYINSGTLEPEVTDWYKNVERYINGSENAKPQYLNLIGGGNGFVGLDSANRKQTNAVSVVQPMPVGAEFGATDQNMFQLFGETLATTPFNELATRIAELTNGLDKLSKETVLAHQIWYLAAIANISSLRNVIGLLPTYFPHARHCEQQAEAVKLQLPYRIPVEEKHLIVHAMPFIVHNGLAYVPHEALSTLKGRDVIDGGACVGDTSMDFSAFNPRRIYAFEASPDTFAGMKDVLNDNMNIIGIDKISRITPVFSALGKERGELTLYALGKFDGSTSAVFKENGVAVQVPMTSIDEFARENNLDVGLIKLDVEGAESSVLEGAIETIKRDKPILLLSIYHTVEQFLGTRKKIESLEPGYRFVIRHIGLPHGATEYMLIGYYDPSWVDAVQPAPIPLGNITHSTLAEMRFNPDALKEVLSTYGHILDVPLNIS